MASNTTKRKFHLSLLNRNNFNTMQTKTTPTKSRCKSVRIEQTYENYLKQYCRMADLLLLEATECHYTTNRISMPITVLIRHCIKPVLKKKGANIPKTHTLENLYLNESLIDDATKDCLSVLAPQQDGSCFRYLRNKNGIRYNLNRFSIREAAVAFIKICRARGLYQSSAFLDQINNKFLDWELTFHPYEIDNEGLMCSQYRDAIDRILSTVNIKVFNIEDIVLPLFFCIRHYVEISIKSNTNKIKLPGHKQTHNLRKELEVLEEYINRTFAESNCDETDVKETYEIISVTPKLVAIFDRIGRHGIDFRYPSKTSNVIKLTTHDIYYVLNLYNGKFENAQSTVTYLQCCGCDNSFNNHFYYEY